MYLRYISVNKKSRLYLRPIKCNNGIALDHKANSLDVSRATSPIGRYLLDKKVLGKLLYGEARWFR